MSILKLTIDKKKYTFEFGLGFLGEVLEALDCSIDELIAKYDKNPFRTVPLLVYHSAKFYLELENKEVDFTLRDITEGIDKDGGLTDKNKSIMRFNDAFVKYLLKDIPKEEGVKTDEEPKK